MQYIFKWEFIEYPDETIEDSYFCLNKADLFETFIKWAKDYNATEGDKITIREKKTNKIIYEIIL